VALASCNARDNCSGDNIPVASSPGNVSESESNKGNVNESRFGRGLVSGLDEGVSISAASAAASRPVYDSETFNADCRSFGCRLYKNTYGIFVRQIEHGENR
jgi:hypothetical protein